MIKYQPRLLGFSRILEATALAAMASDSYYRGLAADTIRDREWFIKQTNTLANFKAYGSHGNFVLMRVNKKVVNKLKTALTREPVLIVKDITKDLFRVSVGVFKYTKRLFTVLQKLDT